MKLSKCLTSIKKYAFMASEYPVILTLEDHLTPDLQAKVAEVSLHYQLSNVKLKTVFVVLVQFSLS